LRKREGPKETGGDDGVPNLGQDAIPVQARERETAGDVSVGLFSVSGL